MSDAFFLTHFSVLQVLHIGLKPYWRASRHTANLPASNSSAGSPAPGRTGA